jgi:hypothetical protein
LLVPYLLVSSFLLAAESTIVFREEFKRGLHPEEYSARGLAPHPVQSATGIGPSACSFSSRN